MGEITAETGVESVMVLRFTPTHTRIVCTGGPMAETYLKGAEGTKSANEGRHEAYCERLHDTGEELFIPDAEADEEWVGADEFAAFGLRTHYGVPVRFGDDVVATVCALHDETYDFESGDPSTVELLRSLRGDVEADIEQHFE